MHIGGRTGWRLTQPDHRSDDTEAAFCARDLIALRAGKGTPGPSQAPGISGNHAIKDTARVSLPERYLARRLQFGRGKPSVGDLVISARRAFFNRASRSWPGRNFCALAGLLGLTTKTFVQALDFTDFAFHAAPMP